MATHRVWLGRAAILAAALASLATKKPLWVRDAAWPAQAPMQTPSDGTRGLLVTISATREPYVECTLGTTSYQLEPLPGTPDRYLCPPGGRIGRIGIQGDGGGGCSKPEPPDSEKVHVDRVDVVETWSVTAQRTTTIATDEYDPHSFVEAASPYQPFATGTFTDASGSPAVHVYKRSIRVEASGITHSMDAEVRATIYGPCEKQPCTPPSDAKLELELELEQK